MDFHGLSRKELQTLCKRNKIPANITNVAMADALSALEFVEGIDELTVMNQVAPQTPSVLRTGNNKSVGSETAQQLSCARHPTTARRAMDQANKNNVPPETPAASTTAGRRKKTQGASSALVPTRQSVRLLEKSMAKLSFNDNKGIRPEPVAAVKIDFSDQIVEHHHSSSDCGEQKNNDDDSKAIKEEIVTENLVEEKVTREDKVTDEISAKVTDDVDVNVEADHQREDQIVASTEILPEAESEEIGSNVEADDVSDSHESFAIQQDILPNEVETNQVLFKKSARLAEDESDSHNCVHTQQEGTYIAEDDFTKTDGSETDHDDDSVSQKSVADKQISHIAEADSVESDNSVSDDLDSHESVAAVQQDIFIDGDDSNQVPIKETASDLAADQLDVQITAECAEELVDVKLLEAYEDDTNSNSVKQTGRCSPLENAKSLVDVYIMPAEEFDMVASQAIAKQNNDSDSGPRSTQSETSQKLSLLQQPDNKENIIESNAMVIMKAEPKKDIAAVDDDDDSNLKSLNDKSLRQLNKMLKKKLQISSNKNKEENIDKNQVDYKPRPALKKLPENLMLAGEPNNGS